MNAQLDHVDFPEGRTDAGFTISLRHEGGMHSHISASKLNHLNMREPRVYTDDLPLNESMAVADGDVIPVPRGHHPCGAPYGFGMYYFNVMAGPLRKWRFVPAPEVETIMERDANQAGLRNG